MATFTEQIERSRRDGSVVQLELRLQMPDRSVKYVHVVAHSRDERGQLEYIGAVQDVTERRRSEEALATVRSELTYVARITSLGVLTASIAHEVNQPLSGIITNASTCVRMLATDPPDLDGARETARRTIRDGHRAADVITRLRGLFTKQEASPRAARSERGHPGGHRPSPNELERSQVFFRRSSPTISRSSLAIVSSFSRSF